MDFKWTMDLGSLVNAGSLLVVAMVGFKKLGVLEFKLTKLWNWFEREHGIEG